MVALAKSSFVLCAAPWQAVQSTSTCECRESSQSFTMLGFTFAWQETQAPPAPDGFAAGLAVAGFVAAGLVDGAAGFFWAVAGAARTRAPRRA